MTEAQDHDFPVTKVIGKLLTAVTFVMDYVKLQFEHPVLTVLTTLAIHDDEIETETGMPGYADALFRQIGKSVSQASMTPGRDVRIQFDDGSTLVVSLTTQNDAGPELAIFEIPPDGMWILRED